MTISDARAAENGLGTQGPELGGWADWIAGLSSGAFARLAVLASNLEARTLLGAKGIATRSKDATRSLYYIDFSLFLLAMASNLRAMSSNLRAMASNLLATASLLFVFSLSFYSF